MDLSGYTDKQLQDVVDAEAEGPSVVEDVKAGAVPWLARGVSGTAGTFGALGDLAGRGEEWVGNKIQDLGATNLAKPFLREGKNLQTISSYATPDVFERKIDPLVQGMGYDPNYQPQTTAGQYVRTGAQFLPGAMAAGILGPESMALSLLRGAGAAAGSETAGQAVDRGLLGNLGGEGSTASAVARALGGGVGGAFAPRAVTPFPAASPLRAEAARVTQEAIEPYGGYINAAQKTGSPRLQSILGEPEDNSKAITQALMAKGGVPWQPGQKFSDALTAADTKWHNDFNWSQQTPITRDPQMWNDVQTIRQNAKNNLTAGLPAHDAKLQEVEEAYKAFQQNLVPQGVPATQLPGGKFLDLRDTLLESNNPYVKKMGTALDEAGKRSNPAWDDLSTRWADLKGLKAGAEKAGTFGETLDPKTVAAGQFKPTPMNQLAEAAAKTTEPVKAARPTGLSDLIPAAAGSIAGLQAGIPGLDPTWGLLLGGAAGTAAKRALSPLATNKAAQAYLGNQLVTAGSKLTPKQAAALLASPVGGVQKSLTGPE